MYGMVGDNYQMWKKPLGFSRCGSNHLGRFSSDGSHLGLYGAAKPDYPHPDKIDLIEYR